MKIRGGLEEISPVTLRDQTIVKGTEQCGLLTKEYFSKQLLRLQGSNSCFPLIPQKDGRGGQFPGLPMSCVLSFVS